LGLLARDEDVESSADGALELAAAFFDPVLDDAAAAAGRLETPAE